MTDLSQGQQNERLEKVGKEYDEFRAGLMADQKVRDELMDGLPPEGLTATYNRFHDPDERLPGIKRLRELHEAMDRALLDSYGWTGIQPKNEFLLDYEEEEDDSGRARTKKKPWRYRWPDETRDEVLARLLALNAERAAEEKLLGQEATLGKKPKAAATSEGASDEAAAKAPAKKEKEGAGGAGEHVLGMGNQCTFHEGPGFQSRAMVLRKRRMA
jgi:hypothetical protein